MRRLETSSDAAVVAASGQLIEPRNAVAAIRAHSPEDLVTAVDSLSADERAQAVVSVDEACSGGSREEQAECVIATASVLAERGVVAFETRHVIAVNRIFATFRALRNSSAEAV